MTTEEQNIQSVELFLEKIYQTINDERWNLCM